MRYNYEEKDFEATNSWTTLLTKKMRQGLVKRETYQKCDTPSSRMRYNYEEKDFETLLDNYKENATRSREARNIPENETHRSAG
ncbi:hypothetical protein CDAR_464861 [Caerostris darwini]|uniref:Uncharacterized protein n=1 Tax=Caerostris darwini TaxID=1538125 RepID=A0AAV4QP05_9ARAC|nr:hypothetical protein CDAR_464861 [Caerostris darwini]